MDSGNENSKRPETYCNQDSGKADACLPAETEEQPLAHSDLAAVFFARKIPDCWEGSALCGSCPGGVWQSIDRVGRDFLPAYNFIVGMADHIGWAWEESCAAHGPFFIKKILNFGGIFDTRHVDST